MTAKTISLDVNVTAAAARLHVDTACCRADPAQPVHCAIDVSVESNLRTGEPAVVVTVWANNVGHGAMIPPHKVLALLKALVDAAIHIASHKITGVDEVRIDDKVAWTSGGGAQGDYAGYLWITPILEGGAGAYHTVNAGTVWGSTRRLTGCASFKMRVKRTGNSKKTQSPFAAGIPSRIVVVGRGIPVYDPRRDSTRGGSGSHRADDQTTWQFTDGGTDLGNNPALQALAYLIGWRIGGRVSVGAGLPLARIDFAAFAAAANACDEAVTLALGLGTQRRYVGAGLFNDSDQPSDVMAAFAATVNGWWDDSNGKLGLFCAVNDLAGALFVLTDDDVLSPIQWSPFPEIAEQYNVVRGLNPDPALPANFQPTDYPEVKITSADGIDRTLALNFAMVQDKSRAQRLAKQVLQRQQYRGLCQLTVGLRGWQLLRGQPIKFTSFAMGWTDKLFRVESWRFEISGDVALTLREEHANIYAWAAEESPAVVPATPIIYDPMNNPFLVKDGVDIGVENGATNGAPTGTLVAGVPAEDIAAGTSAPKAQVALGFATSSSIPKMLEPGQIVSAEAALRANLSGSVTIDIGLEYQEEGRTWISFGSSTPDSGGPGDVAIAEAAGTFSNPNPIATRFFVRATGTRSSGSATAVAANSYLKA